MREPDYQKLIVQGGGALFVFVIIYHFWVYLLGAVVVWVILKEHFRSKGR